MIVELFISKDRVPYIVKELGADRVTVEKLNEGDTQDLIKFEMNSTLDLLHMFHAGIRCGGEYMAKTLIR
jgi:hypothetical protein